MKTVAAKATPKKTILFAVLFAVAFAVLNYSDFGVAGLREITGGHSILDFEFGFGFAKANEILSALGSEGRAFYLTKIIPMDFVFPVTYMLCFVSTLSLLMRYTDKRFRFLMIVPVCAMLADWTENVGIINMLRTFPELSGRAITVASAAGIVKRICIYGSFAAIAVMLAAFILMWRKEKTGP